MVWGRNDLNECVRAKQIRVKNRSETTRDERLVGEISYIFFR